MERITSFFSSEPRYKTLRLTAVLFTLTGSVLLVIGVLLLVFGLYTLSAGLTGSIPTGAGPFEARQANAVHLGAGLSGILCLWSFVILLSGVQFVAVGALFRLLIHLEENTRVSAQCLDKIRMRLEPVPEALEPFFRS